MLSSLFAGDQVLQDVLDDLDRISRTQHAQSESTGLVQAALLIWDPGCLPVHGADSDYGDETAGAVARFKTEELQVPPEELVDDVGPRTVARLDQIAAVDEQGLGRDVAVVGIDGLDQDGWLSIVAVAESVGGGLLMTLGPRVTVLDGGQPVVDVILQELPGFVDGVLTASSEEVPPGLDDDTNDALAAWLASIDPTAIVDQVQAWAVPDTLPQLQGCGQDEVAL